MKIHTFVRYMPRDNNKPRPTWYSKFNCVKNLLNTCNTNICTPITYIVDGDLTGNFLPNIKNDQLRIVKNTKGGSDPKSFEGTLDYINSLNLSEGDIIYLTEDDFMHDRLWAESIVEGLNVNKKGYVTLYDHADKYLPYKTENTCIYLSDSLHWKTTISTVNTYATYVKTLNEDIKIHREYLTRDHDKFIELLKHKRNLISCIPGKSTHCETAFISPVVNWQKIVNETT